MSDSSSRGFLSIPRSKTMKTFFRVLFVAILGVSLCAAPAEAGRFGGGGRGGGGARMGGGGARMGGGGMSRPMGGGGMGQFGGGGARMGGGSPMSRPNFNNNMASRSGGGGSGVHGPYGGGGNFNRPSDGGGR